LEEDLVAINFEFFETKDADADEDEDEDEDGVVIVFVFVFAFVLDREDRCLILLDAATEVLNFCNTVSDGADDDDDGVGDVVAWFEGVAVVVVNFAFLTVASCSVTIRANFAFLASLFCLNISSLRDIRRFSIFRLYCSLPFLINWSSIVARCRRSCIACSSSVIVGFWEDGFAQFWCDRSSSPTPLLLLLSLLMRLELVS